MAASPFPEYAQRFERGVLAADIDLSGKSFAVLALGDRRYDQFCAFGHRIAEWAERSGAEPLFHMVDVDDLGPADLAIWDDRLDAAGFPVAEMQIGAVETRWHVVERDEVAGPSRNREGELTTAGSLPDWEIGDLFELRTPDGHLRDYSIASRPSDDAILLFVRRVVDRGITGVGSGHLTHAELRAASITGRVRSHRSFRPPTGQGPLLAIGAGSGWAGLRPHLLHAMALGQPCRLMFGERATEAESPILAEMRDWQSAGQLDRLDLALSRADGPAGPYVQDVLADVARDITAFLGASGVARQTG